MTARSDRILFTCLILDLLSLRYASDDISIRFTVNPEGPMIVGKQYELQCLIQNMDPSKNVAVRWYKLTQTNSTDTIKTLVSNTSNLLIIPNKNDDGAQYSCEAEGPHGYPPMSSGKLNITVHYISISFVNHSGPMIVGKQYELQCLIQNVDPSKNVAVRWYKLTQTNSTDSNRTLVSNTSKLPISPNKNDDGAQYSCETEGPHGYPPMSSGNFNITVHYEPIINEIKLPSTVPVFRGYPEVLVCEAEGNPKPTISWSLGANNTTRIIHSEKLNITESTPEDVYCTASNSAGRATRRVKVVLKEDYLPLIAGLIAVIVAFVSVIFIFIYSIYYKTAKMGHYSLKDAKPCAQNGDIAQNGKHNPIPMKKLSQSNILA